MKLVVEYAASDINFQSSLFKMQTDQLSFERFEEVFERQAGEDGAVTEQPLFDDDWKSCRVSCHQPRPEA
jgi:hypothetical protein